MDGRCHIVRNFKILDGRCHIVRSFKIKRGNIIILRELHIPAFLFACKEPSKV